MRTSRNSTNLKTQSPRWVAILATAGLLVCLHATTVAAQSMNTMKAVDRTADSLRDRIEQPPDPDRDVADTAIVLTNLGNRVASALCKAFDGDGNAIGRARLRVPPLGLRWALASDISDDRDFIGSVQCFVVGRVSGSSIFFGPGITDLPVHQATVEGAFRLAFPLVAHY